MSEPDYYKLLGVSPDSEDIVIQAAYRALMRRYHPDKNPSESARKKTIEINAAYAVLGDPAKRAAYDTRRAQSGPKKKTTATNGAQSSSPPTPEPPPHKPATAASNVDLGGGRGGIIFASILTLVIIGSLVVAGLNATDMANNTMNVDENLTAIDMNATVDMNATDINATDEAGSIAAPNADEALKNALSELGDTSAIPADLSQQPTATLDYSTIEDAAQKVAKIIATNGMAGARAYSENCHKAVQANPSWTAADGCAAFDYAAAYIDAAVTTQAGWPKNGYFDFQSDNQTDQYAAVGAASYRTYDRLPKIKAAAQQAGLDAFRTELARQQTIRRMGDAQQSSQNNASAPSNTSE